MLCASCRGGGGAGCSSRTFGGQCRDCPRENMCDNSFGRVACHSKVCMCDPGANWLETQRQMMAVCGAVCACCLDATLMSNNNAGPQLILCSTVQHSVEELVERRRARRARLLLSLQRAAQVSCEASDPCVSVRPVNCEETRAVLRGEGCELNSHVRDVTVRLAQGWAACPGRSAPS